MSELDLLWLAGLLEGEGSFLKGPPSEPNTPRISLQMTDEDVVRRAAALLGVTYVHRKTHLVTDWKTTYRITLKGSRAIAMMRELHPHMGVRRQAQIDAAVASHTSRVLKVADAAVAQIRAEYETTPAKVLAERYGVSADYVRRIAWGRQRKRAVAPVGSHAEVRPA